MKFDLLGARVFKTRVRNGGLNVRGTLLSGPIYIYKKSHVKNKESHVNIRKNGLWNSLHFTCRHN